MSENKRRGMIVLEFQMPDGELLTEETRAQLITGLERAFNFEIPGKTPELLSLFAQTWVGRSEEGDAAEAILMRGRLEYPVEVSDSAQAAAADRYFRNDMKEWRQVALSKWRQFKEIWNAYEIGKGHGNSHVAIDQHAYSLAKMVPFLLGMPEEAIENQKPVAPSEFKRPNMLTSLRGENFPEGYQPGDPHHHEERMPAYPLESLEFAEVVQYGVSEKADYEVRPPAAQRDNHEPGPLCGPDCQ